MPRTIPALFRAAAADAPDAAWLVADEETITYDAALTRVTQAAAQLRAAGVRHGDRVIVTPRTTPDYVLTWLALMELGAIQVPINPQGSAAEFDGFISQVEPTLIVTDPDLPHATRGTAVVTVADLFAGGVDVDEPAVVAESDVAVMIPTSGTTGRSKLVMQTHLAYVLAAEGFPFWLRLTSDDRLMTSLPMFHLNAPAYSVLGSLAARASLVLLPEFSATTFLDSARRFGATQFNAIGAMVEILMRQPERSDDRDNPIRICYTGPSPNRDRQLEIESRFGWEIVCGYALSETTYGLVWKHGTRPYGSLGSPRQHPALGTINEARVIDEEGKPVAAGEVGELLFKNPGIMRGYYEMPEQTADVIVEGWLHTGDLVVDNGDTTYTFVGRKKEVIRRRGENLAPAQVEAVLERHPDVREAAVVGVPSALTEEDVKAFLVPQAGASIDVTELRAFAAGYLARFKVPRYFEVVSELPHTATGRIAKHLLPRDRTPTEVDCN